MFLRGVHRLARLRQRGLGLLDRALRELHGFIRRGHVARDELRRVGQRGALRLERCRALFDLIELTCPTLTVDLEAPQLIAALTGEAIREIDARPELGDGSTRPFLGAGATAKLIGCLPHLVLEPRPVRNGAFAVGVYPLA